jgi:formate dehydrogenase maturation protein FdhE
MNVLRTHCRGCDYAATPGKASVNGPEVGVVILRERCPDCGGRMQVLYLGNLAKAHIRHEEQEDL